VLLVASCRTNHENDESKEEALVVSSVLSEEITFNDVLEFSGTCSANREANIGSTIPGKIEKIHYRPGQYVKKGALLVSMSSEMLIMTEVEYRTLEKDFDRVSRLKEKGSISEQDFDHVKAQYDASKAKYEMVKSNTDIVAPFDGIVSDIFVQEGENFSLIPSLDKNYTVQSGILKLMQLNPILVKFSLNEKLVSQVKPGMTVEIRCDAWPEKVWNGKVSLIYPGFNAMTRSTEVEVVIPNTGADLKPGMFARVYIRGIEQAGCSIPITSIVSRKGKEYIWTVEDDKARLTEIQRLAMSGENAIVSGIEPGVVIITSRKSQLAEGMPVRISNK
jgi:membrane fusion protein (multidrug efflux system)